MGLNNNKNDDDDLNDILDTYGNKGKNKKSEMAPLNLEHLSQGNLDVPVNRRNQNQGSSLCFRMISLCCLYCSYICEYAPKCCCLLAMIGIIVPAYFIIVSVFLNPTEQFGVIKNDYTSIESIYDLKVGKIDHWCLKGDNDSCLCEDPLQPQPRGEFKAWVRAHEANKHAIQTMMGGDLSSSGTSVTSMTSTSGGNSSPEIAFIGASIVEEMAGRWFGEERDDPNLKKIKETFQKNFNRSQGATMDAIALGVAGDTSPSILWRLMNGEMPSNFNPKIWWVEVGMNDLGRTQCSEEVVVLGVLRIVEELLKKPNAKIVINSLFPMSDLRGGVQVGSKDFDDANLASKRKYYRQNNINNSTSSNIKNNKINSNGKPMSNRDIVAQNGKKKHNGNKKRENTRNTAKVVEAQTTTETFIDTNDNENNDEKHLRRYLERREEVTQQQQQQQRDLGWFSRSNNKKPPKEVKMDANVKEQKKFTPIIHKERKLPLWTSITSINSELKKFALKHERVTFFDATPIFAEPGDENDIWILKTDMISMRGHPSPAGFEEWEGRAREFAKKLL